MPSTNKTTGLELNQYIVTDKPTMADYNSDMLKIDTDVTECKEFINKTNALLWQGSASAGDSITALNIAKYKRFSVEVDGHNTVIEVDKKSNALRGIGGYATASNNYVYLFSATFSGNNISVLRCNQTRLDADGNTIISELTVNKIFGVI